MRGRFNGRVVGQDYTGRNTRHNGRAGMYNAVQSALAPSLDITLANGLGPLFTYTRATTATVTDFEGLIKNCLSGELRIYGARRVRNLRTSSQSSTGLGADKTGAGVNPAFTNNYAEAPDGTITAMRLVMDRGGSGAGDSSHCYQSLGATGVNSAWVKSNTGSSFVINGELTNQTPLTITTTWRHLSWAGVTSYFGFSNYGTISGGVQVADLLVWGMQKEDVTGQSNNNPSEYVSGGVLSSPFHGYFVDDVKYFSYQNGNTVSSKVVTEAQGAAITGTIGYLPEGARTNPVLQSETLDNASWTTQASLTLTANATTAPSGATTADQITANTTTGSNVAQFQTITLSAGTTYAISMFWKAGTQGSRVKFGLFDVTGSTGRAAVFNMSTGAYIGSDAITGLGLTLVGTPSAESIGNGWFRGQLAVTTSANTSYNFVIYVPNADTGTNQTSGDNYYAWGTQVEVGTFASSYIPTTTAAVARNADVLSAPSAGILNSAAMTIAMRWAPTAAGQGTVFLWGTYVDANNYTAILHDGTNMIARKRIGGVNHDATIALAYSANTTYRVTGRFDSSNGCDIWVGGIKGTNDSTTTAAQVGTTFQMGCDGNSANHSFAVIPTFKAYRSGLSDTQAAAL